MINSDLITPESLARMIDHTFLKPFGTPADIERLCEEATIYHFAMVAINPAEISNCVKLLGGTDIHIGAAIGFPLGQATVLVKDYEIKNSVDTGANEIDMVINIRALQAGETGIVEQEIRNMAKFCRSENVINKVILETCYLTNDEIITVCKIAKNEGVNFVKTSTGFGTAGATTEHVSLMKRISAPEVLVKASGGIRDLAATLAMIEAGASRIGTSNGVGIIGELSDIAESKG